MSFVVVGGTTTKATVYAHRYYSERHWPFYFIMEVGDGAEPHCVTHCFRKITAERICMHLRNTYDRGRFDAIRSAR